MEPLGRYVVVMVPALTGATGSSVCLCVPQHYSIRNLKVSRDGIFCLVISNEVIH